MTEKQFESLKRLFEWEMRDKKDRGLNSAEISTSDDFPDAEEWDKFPFVNVQIWPDNLKAKRYTYRSTGRAIFRVHRLIQIVEESHPSKEGEGIEIRIWQGHREAYIDPDGPDTDENLTEFDTIALQIA